MNQRKNPLRNPVIFVAPERGYYWTRAQVEQLLADGYELRDHRRKGARD